MSGPKPKSLILVDPKPYFSAYEVSKVRNQGGRRLLYKQPRQYETRVWRGRTNEIQVPVGQDNPPDNFDSYPSDPVLKEYSYEENDLSIGNPPEKLVQVNDYQYLSTIESTTNVSTTNVSTERIHSAGAFFSVLGIALILMILLLPLGILIYYFFYKKGDDGGGGKMYVKKFKSKLRRNRKEGKYQRLMEKEPKFYFDTSEESLLQNAEKAYEECIKNKKLKHQLPDTHQKHQPAYQPALQPCFPDSVQPNIVQIKCDECIFSLDETLQSEIEKSSKIKKCKKKSRKSARDSFKECKNHDKPHKIKRTRSRFVTTTIPLSCTSNAESNVDEQEVFARYDSSRPVYDYSKMNKYHISGSDDNCEDNNGYTRTRTRTDRRKIRRS